VFSGLHILINCTRGSVLNGFSLAVSVVQLSTDEVSQVNFNNVVLLKWLGTVIDIDRVDLANFIDGLYFYEID